MRLNTSPLERWSEYKTASSASRHRDVHITKEGEGALEGRRVARLVPKVELLHDSTRDEVEDGEQVA